MSQFLVLQGCPFPASIAPYFALLAKDAGATVNSGYRGEDAAAILHRHGRHTQGELFRTLPAGVANPPGRSTHELRSDGVAYPGPIGRHLPDWCQGIDVNDQDVPRMIAAARARGWTLVQSYHAGVERHHLNFARRPRPMGPRTIAKLVHLRLTLPKS
jgi:hypothetical protein